MPLSQIFLACCSRLIGQRCARLRSLACASTNPQTQAYQARGVRLKSPDYGLVPQPPFEACLSSLTSSFLGLSGDLSGLSLS